MSTIGLGWSDFFAISPLLILLAGTMGILLWECFAPPKLRRWAGFLSLLAIVLALIAALYAPVSHHPLLTPWLRFDPLARFLTVFSLAIGVGITLLSDAFFKWFEASQGEYFFLLLATLFGLILIGSAADFLTLFLGIETLSIALYVLCGYMKRWEVSHEAAIKYFLMGAMATAILLYGIALIYGAVGTTRLDALLGGYQGLTAPADKLLFLSGIALVTLGIAFEAAIVPFHVWAPDVYEGASTPVTAFMAVGTKLGAFAAFIVIFLISLPQFDQKWNGAIALLAYPTLIYANFVALRQMQLRRFFAYSGISHAGFLLIPLAAGTPEALPAMLFYLIVYALATLGCFAVLSFLDEKREGVFLKDLRGLFWRSPWLAVIWMVCFLTLAGIPPTAGFFAKFYLFKVAFQAGYIHLVILGVLMTIVSTFYYLRMISFLFMPSQEEGLRPTLAGALVGCAALTALVLISFYPAPLILLIEKMT